MGTPLHILRTRRHGRRAGEPVHRCRATQEQARQRPPQRIIPFSGEGQFIRHDEMDLRRYDCRQRQRQPPGAKTGAKIMVEGDQEWAGLRDILPTQNL